MVAGQLEIADPSCAKRYTEREKTRLDHMWEIQQAFGLRDFASCEAELTARLQARAWNTGTARQRCFMTRCAGCARTTCCCQGSPR